MRFPAAEASPRPSAPIRTAILSLAILALLSSHATGTAPRLEPARPSLSVHGPTLRSPADRSVAEAFRR